MRERGFFTDPLQELYHLEATIFRAARIVVDTSLHLGEMSFEEAVEFMTTKVPLPEPTARAEVGRYCWWPTQASAYLTGCLEILRIRQVLEMSTRGPLLYLLDEVLAAGEKAPAGAKVDAQGCELDSDRDGVVDRLDRCPGTRAGAKVDANGCEIQEVTVLKGVNFATNSATLTPGSRSVLDETAATLARNPDLRAEVAGHTDSTGADSARTARRGTARRRGVSGVFRTASGGRGAAGRRTSGSSGSATTRRSSRTRCSGPRCGSPSSSC